jgi:hypothetical protein
MPVLSLYNASQIHHTLLPILLQITLDSADGLLQISICPSILDAHHTYGSNDVSIFLACATYKTCEMSVGTRL